MTATKIVIDTDEIRRLAQFTAGAFASPAYSAPILASALRPDSSLT